ncbi:hypothetical protein AB0O34_33900 [Sphaerisporangium sp. NPDC088356]|uniref:hypothetical protein n=1 Tax=Sphaerisporangium sp. NPDC088356 TaxID=3154871 RepID=UPI00343363FB
MLEVVIESPQGHEAVRDLPTLDEVLDLMKAVEDFVDAVAIGLAARETESQLGFILGAVSAWVAQVQEAARVLLGSFLDGLVRARRGEATSTTIVVSRISMNSPLTMELLVGATSSAGVASAVVYLFKNPDKIGSWFPRLQASWYNGRAEAEKARRAYEKLRAARTKMRELQR